ncbi:hypothetical protein PG996_006366 [Apiospora saccharicola]|uniref:Uncharacterized protein n=1 Tax=Apiospora saccharicola TaxID=335842 RepID=A0ABR1VP38_9PEZI
MSGYTVNPKDLQYPEGSGGRDESTNHFQDPSYEDIHGPFRPGSVNYTMSGSDESNLCTYTYNDNTYHQKAAKAVAAPGNEAADLSNFYYCQLPPRAATRSATSAKGENPSPPRRKTWTARRTGYVPNLPGADALDTTYSTQTREISPNGKRWRGRYGRCGGLSGQTSRHLGRRGPGSAYGAAGVWEDGPEVWAPKERGREEEGREEETGEPEWELNYCEGNQAR